MSEAGTAVRVWTTGYQGEELDAFVLAREDADYQRMKWEHMERYPGETS